MSMYRQTEILVCCVFFIRTGLWNLLNADLHRMLFGASSFKFQCPLRSLTSSSSILRVLIHLPIYSVIQRIFPSITCIIKQLLRMTSTFQFVLLLCDILYICYLLFIQLIQVVYRLFALEICYLNCIQVICVSYILFSSYIVYLHCIQIICVVCIIIQFVYSLFALYICYVRYMQVIQVIYILFALYIDYLRSVYVIQVVCSVFEQHIVYLDCILVI